MSDHEKIIVKVTKGSGFFWLGLFAMLIACMHYGYSCNACGCDLIDSSPPGQVE